MAAQNWRNPYYKQKKRNVKSKRLGTALASNGRRQSGLGGSAEIYSLFDTFSSVHGQIKSISSTVRQVEEMFDSIHSIMSTFQGINALTNTIDVTPSKKSGSVSKNNSAQSVLGNLDMDKISQMLQSPMVQSLLSSNKEKGE